MKPSNLESYSFVGDCLSDHSISSTSDLAALGFLANATKKASRDSCDPDPMSANARKANFCYRQETRLIIHYETTPASIYVPSRTML